MKKKIGTLLTVICCVLSTGVGASSYSFYHQDIPKTVVLEETGDILNLRGTALYKRFFQNIYIGAFYSHNLVSDAQAGLADTGPKRMWVYFLYPIDSQKQYWQEAIADNNSPEIVQREQISISQFLKMIDTPFREGDTLALDYVPNVGTKVIIKGTPKGIIKGNEFYNLILKVWMGRQPPSEKFKRDLFNLS